MKRFVALLLFLAPILLFAQGDGDVINEKGLFSGLLAFIVLLVGKFISGLASKAEDWGRAWIDLRIAKLKQKRKQVQ